MKKTITLVAEKGHALTDGNGDYCRAITYPESEALTYYEVEMSDEEYQAKRDEKEAQEPNNGNT